MALVPDYYRVNDFDLNQSFRFEEAPSYFQVGLRGLGIATRMVVHQHHSVSCSARPSTNATRVADYSGS